MGLLDYSFSEKKYYTAGIEYERKRIIKLLKELDQHGTTHSERCARTHAFVDKAIALIKGEQE